MNPLLMLLWHLGQLHAMEKVLVGLIAFGPFVVLGFVVYLVRKRDLAEEEAERLAAETEGEGD